MRNIFFLAFLLTNAALAQGPTVECRFLALEKNGDVGLDEVVRFTMVPFGFAKGSFEPYAIRITSDESAFEINIKLDNKLLSRLNYPLVQIADMPVSASVFGISSVVHPVVDGFERLQYECKKIF